MHVNPILVVDDNAQIVDILSQYIKKEGWPMLAAKTGEEALALFDAAEPSLILLDIMLRGSSGFEVAEFVRSNRLDCKIIILTELERQRVQQKLPVQSTETICPPL